MLKYFVKTTEALRADQAGVVSFEYVIVAACIVATVLAVFGTDGNGVIGQGLTDAINTLVGKLQPA